MMERYQILIDRKLLELIKDLADEEDRKVSPMIRVLVKEAVKARMERGQIPPEKLAAMRRQPD